MLRVFRAVAEEGTLGRAAETLGRTPSALSMTLAQIEEDVGAPLFETERKSRLTPLGRVVLEEAIRATDTFDRGIAAIRRHAQSGAGTVRIAAVPSAAATFLPRAIAAYRAAHPGVRLEISDVDSLSVRNRLQFDEADLGIVSAAGTETGGGVEILRDALGIVCQAEGPVCRAATLRGPAWDQLALEPFIANPLATLVPHPAVAAATEAATVFARNTTTMLSLVAAGAGTTILPAGVAAEARAGLRFLEPGSPRATRRLLLLRTAKSRLNPAAEALHDVLCGLAATHADCPRV